jgi:hypothetical protein
MKKSILALSIAGLSVIACSHRASAQMFTPGDLVVSTYGSLTSDSITDGEATPITLIEYSLPTPTSATEVFADALPTTGIGANVGIQGEDGSSSEGTIQLSGNGEYLTIGGYDGNATNNGIQPTSNTDNKTNFATGTAWGSSTIALGQSADTDVPRVAATIDAFGNVNTSTIYSNVYNTNNPRSVYSPDGTTFDLSGQGSGVGDEGGLYTTTLGNTTSTTPTAIFNVVSTRDVLQYGGNLYYSADQNSSKKGTQTGIFEYPGVPTTSEGSNTGTRLTPVTGTIFTGGGFIGSGSGTTVNFSPQDFAFANSTTMYVADTGVAKDGGPGDGGIQKWSFISNAWTLDYTLPLPAGFLSSTQAPTAADGQTGFEDVAIDVSGNNVDIYGVSYTAGDADPNGLYGVVDSLSNLSPTVGETETMTEIEAAPGTSDAGGDDYNFKGVSFAPTAAVPEPGTWGMALGGLGLLAAVTRARRRKA